MYVYIYMYINLRDHMYINLYVSRDIRLVNIPQVKGQCGEGQFEDKSVVENRAT